MNTYLTVSARHHSLRVCARSSFGLLLAVLLLPGRAGAAADETVTGNLTVNIDTTLNGNLTVHGDTTTIAGELTVSGDDNMITGNLTISGNAYFDVYSNIINLGVYGGGNFTEGLSVQYADGGTGNVSTVLFSGSRDDVQWRWETAALSSPATQMTLDPNGTLTLYGSSGNLVLNPNALSLTNITTASSASAPAISFYNDADTGIFSTGPNLLQFATNSTEKMRIDGAGNVGIGTTSPSGKVHIAGNWTNPTFGALLTNTNTGNNSAVTLGLLNDAGGAGAGMLFNSSNRTADAGASGLALFNGMGNIRIRALGDIYFSLGAGATNVMMLSGGNVGIGTNTPTKKLHVAGTNGQSNPLVLVESTDFPVIRIQGAATRSAGLQLVSHADPGDGNGYIATLSSNEDAQQFRITNSDGTSASYALMVINLLGGNVGIGTVTPTYKLAVNGTMSASGNAALGANLTVTGASTLNGNTTVAAPLSVTADTAFSGNTTTSFGENTTVNFNGTVRFAEPYGDISMGDFGVPP